MLNKETAPENLYFSDPLHNSETLRKQWCLLQKARAAVKPWIQQNKMLFFMQVFTGNLGQVLD
jgi:hypothetical protein